MDDTVVGLLVVGDGRGQYLEQCVESIERLLSPDMGPWLMIDDSGDPEYGEELAERYGDRFTILSHEFRRGMACAVRSGWEAAIGAGVDYLFHVEEDFVLLPSMPTVRTMLDLLLRRDHLAEVTLRRQPWSQEEHEAGHVFPWPIEGEWEKGAEHWIEQTRLFSLNPSLIPREVLELGWPTGNEAEMTQRIRHANPKAAMALWGWFSEPPDCLHIGHERGKGWRL